DASGPLRGALIGACLFEGWADSVEEAERMLAAGEVALDPCHHHRTVGPMAGVTSPSMFLWCLEDPVHGGKAFCNLNEGLGAVLRFAGGNEHFFLNLGMPTAKLALDAARGVPGSTMLTVMARNGTEFGIQTAGTGDRWFTGPAQTPVGLFLGNYGPDDANPDIGDSAITETYGVGGFSMAAAPAIVRFVGGTVPDALATTERMYQVTLT